MNALARSAGGLPAHVVDAIERAAVLDDLRALRGLVVRQRRYPCACLFPVRVATGGAVDYELRRAFEDARILAEVKRAAAGGSLAVRVSFK